MLRTLLDSSADSRVRLAREAVDLVRLGLNSRARLCDRHASDWLLVLVVPVVLTGWYGGAFAILALSAATVFGITAVVRPTIDPRPAIAVTLVAASIAIAKVGSGQPALMTVTFLTAAPLVLAMTIGRTRHLVRASE